MKTLVFNLLVVGALAFMLFDGDPPTSVAAAVENPQTNTSIRPSSSHAYTWNRLPPWTNSEARASRRSSSNGSMSRPVVRQL